VLGVTLIEGVTDTLGVLDTLGVTEGVIEIEIDGVTETPTVLIPGSIKLTLPP
jgi:hypothetical protein